MAVNKVQLANGTTLIDLTTKTLTRPAQLLSGVTALAQDGSEITGTLTVDTTYSITQNLTNVTSSADDTKVIESNSFFTALTPANGMAITSVTVTMGGVDITDQVFTPGTGTKSITANGTYTAADDGLSGYSSVTVNVPTGGGEPSLQSKSVTYTPTTTTQSATVTADTGYDGLSSVAVTVDPIPSEYVVPTGSQTITNNGTYNVSALAEAVVSVPTGGSGVQYATGTYMPSQTFNSTGNREICTLSDIGFTPSRFILRVTDKTTISGTQYAVFYAIFDESWPVRLCGRYSNTSNTSSSLISQASWTTQTNNQFYLSNGTIYFRTTSGYILVGSVEYTWEAYA